MNLNINNNRKSVKYSKIELMKRFLWGFAVFFFRYSPRTFFKWRIFLLKLFGAKIGKHVHIYNTAEIYMPWNLEIGDWSAIGEKCLIYNLGKIVIGQKVTISHKAHLCAGSHEYTYPNLPLLKLPIKINDNVWICSDAFIGPNTTIGEGSVIGACSAVFKDVAPWTVVGGNPARYIKDREMILTKGI